MSKKQEDKRKRKDSEGEGSVEVNHKTYKIMSFLS